MVVEEFVGFDAFHELASNQLPVAGCQLPVQCRQSETVLATGNWSLTTQHLLSTSAEFFDPNAMVLHTA
ncbi:MAG: hypothetical protein ACXW31_09520, partial [Thermoanaerobaculia bacterium]